MSKLLKLKSSLMIGYYGLICATVFGLLVPVISVQLVPLLAG